MAVPTTVIVTVTKKIRLTRPDLVKNEGMGGVHADWAPDQECSLCSYWRPSCEAVPCDECVYSVANFKVYTEGK